MKVRVVPSPGQPQLRVREPVCPEDIQLCGEEGKK